MATEKSTRLEPLTEAKPRRQTGSDGDWRGLSGMTAALNLAQQGYPTYLSRRRIVSRERPQALPHLEGREHRGTHERPDPGH